MTDEDWSKRQETFHAATTRAEERVSTLAGDVRGLRDFALADHSDRKGDQVFNGLRLGLAFHDTVTELNARRTSLADAREGIAAVDAEVASGRLPATAHSWRFQLAARLDHLDRTLDQINAELNAAEAVLRRLCE
jgi:hypothetical protein